MSTYEIRYWVGDHYQYGEQEALSLQEAAQGFWKHRFTTNKGVWLPESDYGVRKFGSEKYVEFSITDRRGRVYLKRAPKLPRFLGSLLRRRFSHPGIDTLLRTLDESAQMRMSVWAKQNGHPVGLVISRELVTQTTYFVEETVLMSNGYTHSVSSESVDGTSSVVKAYHRKHRHKRRHRVED